MKISHVTVLIVVVLLLPCRTTVPENSLGCVISSAELTMDCVASVQLDDISDYHVGLLLGQFSFAHGNYSHSKLLLQHAVTLNPDGIEADELLLASMFFLNEYEEALQHEYSLLAKYGLAYSRLLDRVLKRYTQ